MFGKKHLMTVTVEIPYEIEVAGNVSDIDEIERMYVRIEEEDYVE